MKRMDNPESLRSLKRWLFVLGISIPFLLAIILLYSSLGYWTYAFLLIPAAAVGWTRGWETGPLIGPVFVFILILTQSFYTTLTIPQIILEGISIIGASTIVGAISGRIRQSRNPSLELAFKVVGKDGISGEWTLSEKAQNSHSLISQAFSESKSCVALLLRSGTREIMASNKEAVNVGALPGEKCYRTWGKRDQPCPWCLAPQVWKTGEPQHLVVEDKDRVWDSHWLPIDGDIYLYYAYDITDHVAAKDEADDPLHNLEKTLEELQAAQGQIAQQERFVAVGQLAAGIAHDFNNILVPITLYAEIQLTNPDLPAETKDRLLTILNQAERASVLTEQILDYSRRSLLKKRKLDLIPFFEIFKESISSSFPENINVEVVHVGEKFVVSADQDHLQKSLLNLAFNARDAMPDGGELRFEITRLKLEPDSTLPFPEMPPGEWVQIDVIDNGKGIPREHINRVFDPFFTTKGDKEGGGLGLAQVYGIVKQHDGYIDIKSQIDEGTTFSIYIPIDFGEVDIRKEPMKFDQIPRGDQETILVVEDQVPVRLALRTMLETLNYRVLTVDESHEALDVYDQKSVDLVVSDLVMPGVGGIQLYEKLREEDPDVKMIVVTGYPLGDEGRQMLEKGILDWIKKPFKLELVARKIRQVLEA